jgi:hypothetical protein
MSVEVSSNKHDKDLYQNLTPMLSINQIATMNLGAVQPAVSKLPTGFNALSPVVPISARIVPLQPAAVRFHTDNTDG